MALVVASAVDNWVGLGVAVALVVFLVVELLFPERF